MVDNVKTKAKEQDDVNPEKTDEEGAEEEETSQPLEGDAGSEEEKSDGEGKSEESGGEESEEEAPEESSKEESGEETLDEYLQEEKGEKTGVQKRIDRLTAEKKEAVEQSEELKKKMSELEEKVTAQEASSMFDEKLPDYKPEQVDAAIKKAMEDGDHKLMVEIMDYKVKKGQQDAFTAIEKRNKKMAEQQKKQAEEWYSVVNEFSDDNDKELNLKNQSSLLYRLASELFQNPDKKDRYKKGGQRLAVMDALKLILKKRRGKDTKNLEKKLAKEKRKSTVSGSSKSLKKKGDTKPKSAKDKLSDYLSNERNSAY